MKYIKKFENSISAVRDDCQDRLGVKNFSFEIGDYILLKNADEWIIYPFVEIVDRDSNKSNYSEFSETKTNTWVDDYYVAAYNQISREKEHFWVDTIDIERKLTPEEIENYKIMIDAKKYNL